MLCRSALRARPQGFELDQKMQSSSPVPVSPEGLTHVVEVERFLFCDNAFCPDVGFFGSLRQDDSVRHQLILSPPIASNVSPSTPVYYITREVLQLLRMPPRPTLRFILIRGHLPVLATVI